MLDARSKRVCSFMLALCLCQSPALSEPFKSANLIADAQERETPAQIKQQVQFEADNPSQDRLVIKNGALFMITDQRGMMPASKGEPAPFGIFRDDTRYLSAYQVFLNGTQPRLLASDTNKGFRASFVYGNSKAGDIPEQTIMLKRDLVIADGLFERMTLTNYSIKPIDCELAIVFDSDFADMFEVRGSKRPARGTTSGITTRVLPQPKESSSSKLTKGTEISIDYRGLDNFTMRTILQFHARDIQPDISDLTGDRAKTHLACYKLHFNARETKEIEMSCHTWTDAKFEGVPYMSGYEPVSANFDEALKKAESDYKNWREQGATVTTSDTNLNDILERAYRDLYILRQKTPKGICLAAGTPWFACAFGRDQAVTALEMLPLRPDLAREVITILAAYQGSKRDDYTEERPGRIMHELRLGEMARLGEIPFKPYYGTVDATPLWLMLIVRYAHETNDLATVEKLWPNIERALAYLDSEAGDNGYLRYGGKGGAALSNQGWKDSGDSIMYADGKLAKQPIALCEPQAYLYEAWTGVSGLADRLGRRELSTRLTAKANALKKRFNQDFWMDKQQFVALALDGDGRQCDVISSNPGHILASGILDNDRASLVGKRLMQKDMFSGWGIRTLAASEAAYNPMSYHDGSVWPHDNALAVEGLCMQGLKSDAYKVMRGLADAAQHEPDTRLPELFCGFEKQDSNGPIRYPVSCVPQAWAAGSMFLILTSCLGITENVSQNTLTIKAPVMPEWLNTVTIKGLRHAGSKADLRFARTTDGGKAKVEVLKKSGKLTIAVD